MRASTSIDIAAPAHEIYALAEDVGRWPELLPHYRYVRVLRSSRRERLAVMAARRGWIGVRWTAIERLDPDTPSIEFTHVSGWTVGMEVAWRFEPMQGGTRVVIEHDLDFRLVPIAGEWIGRRIIGDFFIQAIASKTLACFKELAEARL
jgi:ribosome-associated toxin RatA of RatAB toxin-antitoxin module